MAGTTTYYGISYPTSTDYVKDGATAMQTIADGFDSAVAIPTYNNQTGTSYTFVLTDAGKTVTSNNASAVTFTIPPQASVAWANNTTLTVRNLGAGVVTIAGGAGVTVTNTAQTVAQYGSVRIIRTASNAWTVVPASGSSGFNLITTTSFSAQSTASINDVFSANYAHYKIIFNGTGSADVNLNMRMRVAGADNTSANYGWAQFNWRQSASSAISTTTGLDTVFTIGDVYSTGGRKSVFTLDIFNPFATDNTNYVGFCSHYNGSYHYGDVLTGGMSVTTSYTGFSLIPSSGTITGTVSVYGMTV